MTTPRLTIGQLADHVGVTIRAVRHYHARGLLPEPERDASGYRRYDAKAVVDLVRIKTLAEAGVPLARIAQLLRATPAEFEEAVASIDRTLEERIDDLQEHRRRLTELAHGERPFLPDDVVTILEQMRELGVSERTVQIERDGWIVVSAVSPGLVPSWARQKQAALTDPAFRDLYLACDEAFDWDPDDPRLNELAERMANWSLKNPHSAEAHENELTDDQALVVQLMTADVASASPAWKRLGDLATERAGLVTKRGPDTEH